MESVLSKALSLLMDLLKDDDYVCERLMEIPDENKYCLENCENMTENCILRYLRRYKKEEDK